MKIIEKFKFRFGLIGRQFIIILIFFLVFIKSSGQLLLSEAFDYSSGVNLGAGAGGWSNLSMNTTGSVFVTGSNLYLADALNLTVYKGYVGHGINSRRRAKLESTYTTDVVRDLSTSVNSGTIYMSFLVGSITDSPNSGTSGAYFVASNSGLIGAAYRVASNGQYTLTISGRSATYNVPTDNNTVAYTAELLIVLKYQFVSGSNNDIVSLYFINTTDIPANEPSPIANSSSGTDLNDIDRIGLFQNGSAEGSIDGLRVARTWSELFQWPLPSAQPTNLTYSNITTNSAQLAWTAASGAPFGYLILRKAGSPMAVSTVPNAGTDYNVGDIVGDSEVVATGKGSGYTNHYTTFNNTGLSSSTTYYYKIYSYNGQGNFVSIRTASPLSGSITTLANEPTSQPSALAFSSISSNSMSGSFTAASGTPTGYIVLRKIGSSPTDIPIDGISYTTGVDIGTSRVVGVGTLLSFVNSDLDPGSLYYYDIFSYNGVGSSINYRTSSPLEGSQFTRSTEPIAHPQNFSSSATSTQVNLAFSQASLVAGFGYIILRRQDGENPTVTGITDGNAPGSLSLPLGTTLVTNITSSTSTSFNNVGLTPGLQYNYLIIPYNYNGSSPQTYNYKTDGTPLSVVTTTPYSASSSIITDGTFINPINIIYSNYQEASNLTIANSIEVARYIIEDGGGTTDADNKPTVLNSISFSLTNALLIRRVALYDGTTELEEAEPSDNTVSFSALNISAPDNSSKTFSVWVSFNATVTDNQQFSFTVASATTQAGNSGFAAANAGGAVTSTAGDKNRIEVTATKIVYTTQPPSLIGVNTNILPTPVLDALDALNNKDLDYSLSVTVSNSALLTMVNAPTAFSSGTLTFPNNFQFTSHGMSTLTVTSGSLTSAVSSSIVVRAAEPTAQPTSLTFNTITGSSMNAAFTASSGSPSGYLVLRNTSTITDFPVDGTVYTAGTSNIGASSVIYVGSGTSFTSTVLNSGVVYYYAVFAFNGSGVAINYRQSTPLQNNQSTIVTEPTTQTSVITFSNLNTTALTVNWTNGNGTERLVVARQANAVSIDPSDGVAYSGNSIFSDAADLGSGNKVVYRGTANSVTVTNLIANTVYHFRVYELNGAGALTNYMIGTAVNNPGSRTTLQTEPSTQPTSLNFPTVKADEISGSFNAAPDLPTGYLVLRKQGSAPTFTPQDGTAYNTGTQGDAIVVASGSSTTFTDAGLVAGTVYHYIVFSYNGSSEEINYNTTNPLSNSKFTLPDKPTVSLDNPTATNFYASWISVPGATGYELDVSLTNGFINFVGVYSAFSVGIIPPLEVNVSGLQSNTEYFVRVRAINASGKSENSDWKSITTSSIGGSNLSIGPISQANEGGNISLSVVLGNPTGTPVVKFHSRKIMSDVLIASDNLQPVSGTTYQVTITPAMLDELGLECYFTASDASTTAPLKTPANNSYYIYTSLSASEKSITNLSFGGQFNNYRIFSIPYNLDDNLVQSVFGIMGEYDKEKWRLIQYDPLTKKNKDYPAFNRLDLGKGYWFNSIEKVDVRVGSGTAPQFNQATPFTMRLEQGWNQIGAPYPFDIKWSAVQSANSGKTVGKLFVFNPTTQTMVESNDLKAWSGGFVHADNVITDFTYPVTLKNASGGRNEANDLIDNTRLDEPIWFIPIILKQGGAESRIAVGMHPEASTGKDRFDQIAVPRFFNYLEMTTTHPEFFSPAFAYDVVPTQSYQTWNFIFNSSFITSSAILEWDPQSLGDNEAVLILFDEREKTFVNMRETNRYVLPAFKDYPLKIIYASKQEWNPGVTLLGNPFPNPTSTQVTIPVALHEPASVQISVYDLAGKKVKSLAVDYWEAGMHSVTWQCDDELSTKVPPAIYFVRMAVGSRSFTQKIMVK